MAERKATIKEQTINDKAAGLKPVFDTKRSVTPVSYRRHSPQVPTQDHDLDDFVKIPMLGTIGSLNVSVAGGILMFEVSKQRLNP